MNREAEKIDFEYATAYLQAKDITGSVSGIFADGFSYTETNGELLFVDWESVQKLGMNHLDNLIHDAKKVQEQSAKNSMQRETVKTGGFGRE